MNTLYIDPDMTLLFNFCTRQQDYNEFYDTYKRDIEICAQRLEHLEIPKNTLCHFITQNVAKLFTILTASSSCNHRKLAAGCCRVELEQPEFIDNLKKAIEEKDWQPFYEKYWKYADTIIKEARRQRLLGILIEWRSETYLNFESRDKAILAQSNDTMRISVNRASSSVENRSGMRLLPYEPEDGGNNETEISPGGPGSSSALEEFGEIGVIASETPEESAMELPGRIDQEQSSSSGVFSGSSGSNGSRDLSLRGFLSYESYNDRPGPDLNIQEEYPEVNTSEVKIAELRDELSSMLASLSRNNEAQTREESLSSSTNVMKRTATSRTATSNDDFQLKLDDEYRKHEREMWKLSKFQSPEIECKPQMINEMMEDFDNLERKMEYKDLTGFESTLSEIPLEPSEKPQDPTTSEDEFEEYEKEMNKVLEDVIKKQSTEEKNKDLQPLEDDPPETILDMITDFIEKMWEG